MVIDLFGLDAEQVREQFPAIYQHVLERVKPERDHNKRKPEAQAEAEEELLSRLVALNIERTAEEARGHIRWLRPEYQNPSATVAPEQSEAVLDDTTDFESIPAAAAATGKLTWPKQMREQVAAVRHALSQSPLPADALAAQFKRSWTHSAICSAPIRPSQRLAYAASI